MPNENSGAGRRGGRGFLGAVNRGAEGARNAIPGTRNWQWQQTLDAAYLPGNWYDSQTRQWQLPGSGMVQNLRALFGGGSEPGQALPSWMVPGAQGQQPANPLAMPNYTDPNAWGPPENLAGQAPGLAPVTQGTATRGGGLRGTEIAAPLGISTPGNAYVNPWLGFWSRDRGEK